MNFINPILLSTEAANSVNDLSAFIEYIFHSNVINNLLVLLFLVWLFKKFNILSGIDRKKQSIVSEIEDSEKQKQVSEKLLEEKENSYKNVDNDVIKIKENSKEVTNSLVKEISEASEQDVKDIEAKTIRTIDAEEEKTVKDVSDNVAKAALLIAQEHIKKSLDVDMHNKFIEEFIDEFDEVKLG